MELIKQTKLKTWHNLSISVFHCLYFVSDVSHSVWSSVIGVILESRFSKTVEVNYVFVVCFTMSTRGKYFILSLRIFQNIFSLFGWRLFSRSRNWRTTKDSIPGGAGICAMFCQPKLSTLYVFNIYVHTNTFFTHLVYNSPCSTWLF